MNGLSSFTFHTVGNFSLLFASWLVLLSFTESADGKMDKALNGVLSRCRV